MRAWLGRIFRFAQDHEPHKRYVSTAGAVWFALPLVFVGILIVQNTLGVWPDDPPVAVDVVIRPSVSDPSELDAANLAALEERVARAAADSLRARARADSVTFYVLWGVASRPISWDFRLLLLTVGMGALGAWVHAASSFVRFVGNRQFVSSWAPWYLFRPLVGSGLALIFYTVLRAGLATTGGSTMGGLSHYSVAAFAGLVGLFSERASKKLADVFDALFTPRIQDQDLDGLEEPAIVEARAGDPPEIAELVPAWIEAGVEPVPIRVTGSGFQGDSVVWVDGGPVPTTRVDDDTLEFTLEGEHRNGKGTLEVTVHGPSGSSSAKRLLVTP
jgi:hypothetical protein